MQANDPQIERVSMLGQKQVLTAAANASGSGVFRLELGDEPVYIHTKHPGLRLLPSPIIALAQEASGTPTGFHFTVVNTSQLPWQAGVVLSAPTGWNVTLDAPDFSLEPGKQVVIQGVCDIPADTKKGAYTVNATLKLPDGNAF